MLFTLNALLLLVARLFAYLIKTQDGRDVKPVTLIESAIVDSQQRSDHLLAVMTRIRRDRSIEPED
ncbi:MAG: hypothetical protein HC915_15250 [Anaerolineae bacterium]|nr:hypothetical protein [Anaerolineae bacterium]